ncbi:integrase, catalytic region, zinc finger, CCHC-type containing protein [Tanacetum coccineum]|uniref:Integrase, catalytic region, zinc finger, CCHC-type containing protein n=1 Tax=Tanacetum coccineum TaxID=301880 RepID=A0ABQ5G049_9ASTR
MPKKETKKSNPTVLISKGLECTIKASTMENSREKVLGSVPKPCSFSLDLNIKSPKFNQVKTVQLEETSTSVLKVKHLKCGKVKKDIDETETINIELEHSVAKLLFENENLRKEQEHLKSIYKDQFDSIKKTRVQSKEHSASLIAQINAKKLKGKNVVEIAVSNLFASVASECSMLDIETYFSFDLRTIGGDAHEVYLDKTIEYTNTLRGLVECARKHNHSESLLESACMFTKHVQELIASTKEVPNKESTIKPAIAPSPELKVYSRKPKASRSIGSSSKVKIVESKTSNIKEPKQSWGSNVSDVQSSSRIDCRLSKLFCGTVRFVNDHIAKIMGYRDYQMRNVTISLVYYVEGLGHNVLSVGQFCDSDLEVAFRKHICFIRNLDGVDLLKGSRGSNLYILSMDNLLLSSPICLLSKALKTKSWLWHKRLSHLNFDYITSLVKQGLVRGLQKLKYQKDYLCSAYALAEAFTTACYTQNRSLIRKCHNKTPYELLHDQKPDLSYLHVFGALCYPTNDDEDLGKLKPKADIGIFVGYALQWLLNNSVQDSGLNFRLLEKPVQDSCKTFLLQFLPAIIAPEPVVSTGTPSLTTIDQEFKMHILEVLHNNSRNTISCHSSRKWISYATKRQKTKPNDKTEPWNGKETTV